MNKSSSWNECISQKYAINISPDKAKAKSLIGTAEARIEFITKIRLEESNANFIFENYYSSMLEIMHAFILLKGFKVENHICLGYYLRDILKKEELFRIFDDARYKRNSLVYYGQRMDFETAKNIIEKIKELAIELENIIEKISFAPMR